MIEFCKPHFERVGRKVPAERMVGSTPMCLPCYLGKPVKKSEENGDPEPKDSHWHVRLSWLRRHGVEHVG